MSSELLNGLQAPAEHVFEFSGVKDALAAENQTLTLPSNVAVKLPEEINSEVRERVEQILSQLKEVELRFDPQGRVLLDLGLIDAQPEDEEHQAIFKHLEHFSCDEYDDFNPRHPLPRDRAHRRGDSYFNSDIEMVVGELGNQVKPVDLSSIARAALEEPNPTAAAAASAEGSTTGAKSLKDRILSRAKNNVPGRPKSTRAFNALNEDSDEDK